MKRSLILLISALLAFSCSPRPAMKVVEGPIETYISPCLFLKISDCPAEMFLSADERGYKQIKGIKSTKTISLLVEECDVLIDFEKAESIVKQLSKTIDHENLRVLAGRLDSLQFTDNRPARISGIFRTDIMNWIFLPILKSGDLTIIQESSGDTIKNLRCAGFRKQTGTQLNEGADFWIPDKGPFFRIVLKTGTD
jgi:hypothetical protein